MRPNSLPDRQPPSRRENKTAKSELANKKEIRGAISDLEVKLDKLTYKYQQLIYTRDEHSLEEKAQLSLKIRELYEQLKTYRFALLSEDECRAKKAEYLQIQDEMAAPAQTRSSSYEEPSRERKELRLRLRDLTDSVPSSVLGTWVRQDFLRPNPEQEERFSELYQQAAESAVEYGLQHLWRVLEELESRNELPEVIIYPETAARPLRYAVKPLVDAFYGSRDMLSPPEFFFKIHTSLVDPDSREEKIEMHASALEKYGSDLQTLTHRRHQLIQRLKHQKTLSSRKLIATEIDQVDALISAIETQRANPSKVLDFLESDMRNQLMQSRLQEILTHSAGKHALIVDDVVSQNFRTLRAVDDAFRQAAPNADYQFFSFMGSAQILDQKIPDPLKERVWIGTSYSSDSLSPEFARQFGHFIDTADEDEGSLEWGELYLLGFPYRGQEKEQITGVTKSYDDSPYTSRTTPSDSERMREVREYYRGMGERIAKEIGSGS